MRKYVTEMLDDINKDPTLIEKYKNDAALKIRDSPRGLEDVHRCEDVVSDDLLGILDGFVHVSYGRRMDDVIGRKVCDERLGDGVRDVHHVEVECPVHYLRMGACRAFIQYDDLPPLLREMLGDMAEDEPEPAGDK